MICPGVPRKVIVATTILDTYAESYPGVEKRLQQIEALFQRAQAESRSRYGRGPDLFVLPEDVLGDKECDPIEHRSFAPHGPEVERMGRMGAAGRSYVVLPFVSRERDGTYRNAAYLLDRSGRIAGAYFKAHPVLSGDIDGNDDSRDSGEPERRRQVFEGGVIPGREFPVFQTDFGRLGIQICFDIPFDRGWESLAAAGAELVVWPTESPQTRLPCARAERGGYYIVSATTRLNASLFDPAGSVFATIGEPADLLVAQIDLSFAVINWSARLKDGRLLDERYGECAGYQYYESEDRGIFWSNDVRYPIETIVADLGLTPRKQYLEELDRALARDMA